MRDAPSPCYSGFGHVLKVQVYRESWLRSKRMCASGDPSSQLDLMSVSPERLQSSLQVSWPRRCGDGSSPYTSTSIGVRKLNKLGRCKFVEQIGVTVQNQADIIAALFSNALMSLADLTFT